MLLAKVEAFSLEQVESLGEDLLDFGSIADLMKLYQKLPEFIRIDSYDIRK